MTLPLRDSTPSPDDIRANSQKRLLALLETEGGTVEPEKTSDEQEETAQTSDQQEEEQASEATETEGEGEEKAEAGTEEGEGEAEKKYTVIVDGAPLEVTLDEALKGYRREADYTQKTQEVAEIRKAAIAEAEQTRVAREQYLQRLAAADAMLQASLGEPDFEKMRNELTDSEFAAAVADHQQKRERLEKLRVEQARVAREAQAESEREFNRYVARESAALYEKVPEWKDSAKARTEQAQMMEYGRAIGYSEDELANVNDHRAMLILRKAMLYDAMKKAQPKVVRDTAKPATKTVKPGASKVPAKTPTRTETARQKLATAKDQRSAEEFFFAALEEGTL